MRYNMIANSPFLQYFLIMHQPINRFLNFINSLRISLLLCLPFFILKAPERHLNLFQSVWNLLFIERLLHFLFHFQVIHERPKALRTLVDFIISTRIILLPPKHVPLLTLPIVDFGQVPLGKIQLYLPLLAFFEVLIVRVLLRRLVHLNKLEEYPILFQLGEFLVLTLDVFDFLMCQMHKSQRINSVLRLVDCPAVFFSNDKLLDNVFLRVSMMIG